jgi:hypothetical protein
LRLGSAATPERKEIMAIYSMWVTGNSGIVQRTAPPRRETGGYSTSVLLRGTPREREEPK